MARNNKNNKQRVALITGASSGLGRYLAIYFAKKNIRIAAIARNQEKLKSLKGEIENSGGEAEIMSSENIAGQRLVDLGSIVGILRYKPQ